MLAQIPYETFPEFDVGPLTIRTFGTMVGIGVLLGAWAAARYLERVGIDRDETYRLATRMIIWGVIGSRVTWVFSHLEEIDSPIDVIAVWEGGLQFSGGFIGAIIAVWPTMRKWPRRQLLRNLDGYSYGLTIGLAFGRIGCYSVGEHFGSVSSFFLATEFRGGETREDFLGDELLTVGTTFHNTPVYEFIFLIGLFGFMTWLVHRRGARTRLGLLAGLYMFGYGLARFLFDFLRVNDDTVLGLTGAQYMCLVVMPVGLRLMLRGPSIVAADEERREAEGKPQWVPGGTEEPAHLAPAAESSSVAEAGSVGESSPVADAGPADEEPAPSE